MYLAAIMDKRLHGQPDAVYFVLRGQGMKVVQEPGSLTPRINVSAQEMPMLFATLRKMGIRANDRIITLTPKPPVEDAAGEGLLPTRSTRSLSDPVTRQGTLKMMENPVPPLQVDAQGGIQQLRKGARARSPSEKHKAMLDRLSLPKHAAKKHPFIQAYCRAVQADREASSPSHARSPRSRAKAQPLSASMQDCGYHAATASSWSRRALVPSQGIDPFWEPPPPRPDPEKQRTKHIWLAQPKRMNGPLSRSLPCLQGPSAAGLAAQRDLDRRLAKLRERQAEEDEARLQAQEDSEVQALEDEIARLEALQARVELAWTPVPRPPVLPKGLLLGSFDNLEQSAAAEKASPSGPRGPGSAPATFGTRARFFEEAPSGTLAADSTSRQLGSAPASLMMMPGELPDQVEQDLGAEDALAALGIANQRGMVGWQLAQPTVGEDERIAGQADDEDSNSHAATAPVP